MIRLRQPQGVDRNYRIIGVIVEVETSGKSYRILADILTSLRVIVAVKIIVQPRLVIGILSLKSQRGRCPLFRFSINSPIHVILRRPYNVAPLISYLSR